MGGVGGRGGGKGGKGAEKEGVEGKLENTYFFANSNSMTRHKIIETILMKVYNTQSKHFYKATLDNSVKQE